MYGTLRSVDPGEVRETGPPAHWGKIMPRMLKMQVEEDGWSELVAPENFKFRLACCDCGLAHDIKFYVMKEKDNKNGYVSLTPLSGSSLSKLRIAFKMKRNNRSTSNMRKSNKYGIMK